MLRKGLLFLSVFLIVLSSTQMVSGFSSNVSQATVDYMAVASSIDMAAIRKHVEFFSALGSRMTGYPGANEAARYIYDKFVEYGLSSVEYHTYNITIPIDYGANLTIHTGTEQVFKVYPLWPNLACPVTTPPEGITGPITYVGTGSFKDMKDKPVEGGIVVIDWGPGMNWLDAAQLGAKAVVFVAPSDTSWREASQMVLSAAFNFPRFYISKEDAQTLLSLIGDGKSATVKSTMRFEIKEAQNVIGFVEGTQYPDQLIILSSSFDSFSYIPSISPGAEEALGIASLLEMAKYFRENPPKYSIVFIAFSGRDRGGLGARMFAQDYVIDKWDEFGSKIILWIDLTLSSDSKDVQLINSGGLYSLNEGLARQWLKPDLKKYFETLTNDISRTLNKNFTMYVSFSAWVSSVEFVKTGELFVVGNSEVLENLDGPGIFFVTAEDTRKYWFTAFDTVENINFDNVKWQLELLHPFMYAVANTEDLKPTYLSGWKYRFIDPGEMFGNAWSNAYGQIAAYNETLAWYSPVPNAIIVLQAMGTGTLGASRIQLAQMDVWEYYTTDENGKFYITGCGVGGRRSPYYFRAYVIDPVTGNLLYAPDKGRYSIIGRHGGSYPPIIGPTIHPYDVGIWPVFKCGTIVLFDAYDIQMMSFPEMTDMYLDVYEFRSHAYADYRGFEWLIEGRFGKMVSLAFVPPNIPVEILVGRRIDPKYPYGSLINSSKTNPTGAGYTIQAGEQRVLTLTPYWFAKDFHWLNEGRFSLVAKTGIVPPFMSSHQQAGELINKGEEALKARNYLDAYSSFAGAWRLDRSVYRDSRVFIEDTISTLPFFGLLVVPFAFLVERVIFDLEGKKRIAALIISYGIPVTLLSLFHPGFVMASNAILVFIAFVTILLISPIILIVIGLFLAKIQERRKRIYGAHFAELSRSATAMIAFSYGIRHMRRRALRTFLELFTVIVMVSSLVSFASVSAAPVTRAGLIEGIANYEGIFIQHEEYAKTRTEPYWGAIHAEFGVGCLVNLGIRVVDVLEATYGENITAAPRAWSYRLPYGGLGWVEGGGAIVPLALKSAKGSSTAWAMLGLTPQEAEVTGLDKFLTSGRWFIPEDFEGVILPDSVAKELNVQLGEKVSIFGVDFVVVGIFDSQALREWKDLNQLGIGPLNYLVSLPWYTKIDMEGVIIVPYRYALARRGAVMEVAIGFKDPSQIVEAAREIFNRFGLRTYASYGGKLYLFAPGVTLSLMGWQYQVVPVLLVVLSLFVTVLAGITERLREVSVFSVVGLSPSEVGVMFLSECLVYAVVGGVVGYIISMGVVSIGRLYFPAEISLNYASQWPATAMLFTMAVTIGSALYPLLKVSRLVTPSLERRWRLPEPKGDLWEIIMPFTTGSRLEALGFLSFLSEFLEGHRTAEAPDFSLRDLKYEEITKPNSIERALNVDMNLAPSELGVRQSLRIILDEDLQTKRFSLGLFMVRKEGGISAWMTSNRVFIDLLRKQMLLWGGLRSSDRETYYKRFTEIKKKD